MLQCINDKMQINLRLYRAPLVSPFHQEFLEVLASLVHLVHPSVLENLAGRVVLEAL